MLKLIVQLPKSNVHVGCLSFRLMLSLLLLCVSRIMVSGHFRLRI